MEEREGEWRKGKGGLVEGVGSGSGWWGLEMGAGGKKGEGGIFMVWCEPGLEVCSCF